MKAALIILGLVVASCTALPTKVARSSVLDLLEDLENMVHEDGKKLIGKMINAIHAVESGVVEVRDLVPKAYEKLHQEIDEILAGLKKVTEEIQEVLGKQNVQYGFDLDFLSGLTDLSGGTKLSTVLSFLSLADKAHRVMNDAKGFEPRLNEALSRVQDKVQKHVDDFAHQVIEDLGLKSLLNSAAQSGISDKFEELLKKIKDEAHFLVADLAHKMRLALDLLKLSLPDEDEKLHKAVHEIEEKLQELVDEVERSLGEHKESKPVKPSTIFSISNLMAKFRSLVSQAKSSGVKVEKSLGDSVASVEKAAVDFYHKIFN